MLQVVTHLLRPLRLAETVELLAAAGLIPAADLECLVVGIGSSEWFGRFVFIPTKKVPLIFFIRPKQRLLMSNQFGSR